MTNEELIRRRGLLAALEDARGRGLVRADDLTDEEVWVLSAGPLAGLPGWRHPSNPFDDLGQWVLAEREAPGVARAVLGWVDFVGLDGLRGTGVERIALGILHYRGRDLDAPRFLALTFGARRAGEARVFSRLATNRGTPDPDDPAPHWIVSSLEHIASEVWAWQFGPAGPIIDWSAVRAARMPADHPGL